MNTNQIVAQINTFTTTVEGLVTSVGALVANAGGTEAADLSSISTALGGLATQISALSAVVNGTAPAPVAPAPGS